ncbi:MULTISPECIES: helix-turn-helix domain-containing protein [Bacillota]|uniref:Helix-turn-helix transcriptional regulator n=2 Tax=Amedibacillus TaxID=2749846 RepID=A0A7G9GTM5_9FIRM|nr:MULTISPECIES: helix-turn-helix transcriptional regulator [Bacillota]MCH4287403.1 helix-turn-helix domain-containing protein [Amedibacillus hominis]QNM14157.1 helix-turn-helix transcriptional regulator [[Eubacterium] hominis]RGB49001.1 XRE family transcriptional regulator [Absiella sp. AM22-9]RGB54132.1 XRE family transcriptional regulator [Absiella sp. AM10-20]RGB62977.1 XRE family transcriptional regulator [Absiella sp. AM09-45]
MRLDRLRELRQDRDMSCAKLARELDISERVLRYYENGDHTMPLEILIKIADYFQVSTDYLLGRTKNKRVYKHEPMDHDRYLSE